MVEKFPPLKIHMGEEILQCFELMRSEKTLSCAWMGNKRAQG